MCKIVESEPADAVMFKPLSCYDSEAPHRVLKTLANGCLKAFTLIDGKGNIIGIVGASQMFDRSASLWALLGEDVKKHPIFVHKTMVKLVGWLMKNFQLERIHTFVNANNPQAIKQNKNLGFVSEGLLKKFGPSGEDQYIFARYA